MTTGTDFPSPDQSSPPARPALVSIEVEALSKRFNIGSEPTHTLKERVLALRRNRSTVFQALTDVEFEVRKGETFGILGHNGSGKSTLLKIMAGTYRPTTGRVRVRGRLSALLELGAGFHPDLTGRENIYLNGSILGFSRDHIDEIFDDIVDFAGVEEFIDLQVKYYSSGMTARLGFAVATNLEPDVLLVDEVLAVGDEAFQAKCMERVHRFRRLGRTMVIVSHSPENIRELCDRALVLDKGRMLHVGEVDEAIKVYREALHGPSKASGAEPRPGSTEEGDVSSAVKILRASILGDGAPPVFAPGDRVPVVVRYQASEPTEMRVRLIMRTQDNNIMMNRSTNEVLGHPVAAEVGDGEVRFALEDIPLLDGTYRLTVAVESVDGKVTHDRIHVLGEFVIKGPGAGYGRVDVKVSATVAGAAELAATPEVDAEAGSEALGVGAV